MADLDLNSDLSQLMGLINQGARWVELDGTTRFLDEMKTSHLHAVLRMLERHAAALKHKEEEACIRAGLSVEPMLATSVRQWLDSRPLIRSLRERLAER